MHTFTVSYKCPIGLHASRLLFKAMLAYPPCVAFFFTCILCAPFFTPSPSLLVIGRFEIDGTATPVPPARFNVTFTNGRLSIGDWKTEFSLRLLNPTGYVDITYLDGRFEISKYERSGRNLEMWRRGGVVALAESLTLGAA